LLILLTAATDLRETWKIKVALA